MRILLLSKKNLKRNFVLGGAGLFMILGLIGQTKAEDPLGALKNAPNNTAPSAPTKSNSSPAVKPLAIPSNQATTQPASPPSNQDLGELSIDQLLNVTVTSAGQKEQKLSDVAAALTVLNADDINRSGATNIPDLLRYVPGVEVGQATNTDVSVSIRGFGGVFATKLLVLIDGRSIYDPLFGGVDWQFQTMMMDNIDRVEVIRGPGATVWGANAVDGVINIITKDSQDTLGGLASVIYGTKEQGEASFRYGLQPATGLTLRLYGQYENIATSSALPGNPQYDDGQNATGGFRADYRPDSDDHFRLSSDVQSNNDGEAEFLGGVMFPPTLHETNDEENVNFVWEHNFDTDNQLTVQSYYDRFAHNSDPADLLLTARVQTADVQIRHSLPLHLLPIKQELIYGLEYREVSSELDPARLVSWTRPGRDDQTVSAFVQTDLHLIDDVLTLTAGSKYDHNDFTGNEVQPSARLLWKIDSHNSLWWAASRAVREPTLNNVDEAGLINGNPNIKSEVLISYEMGYRVQPVEWLSIDVDGFYNNYNNLIESFIPPDSATISVYQFQKAQTYGVEPSFTAQIQPWWKMTGSYSLLSFHVDDSDVPAGSTYIGDPVQSSDPSNEISLRCSFDLPNNIDIDLGERYVDKIFGANGYFATDVRVAWKPTKNWEVSVVGQNLLSANHVENPNTFSDAAYVGPEVYGKVVFKF
jgi:iron complex outermembrane recepter protein